MCKHASNFHGWGMSNYPYAQKLGVTLSTQYMFDNTNHLNTHIDTWKRNRYGCCAYTLAPTNIRLIALSAANSSVCAEQLHSLQGFSSETRVTIQAPSQR